MKMPEESLFDVVVLALGPIMAVQVVGLVMLLVGYARP